MRMLARTVPVVIGLLFVCAAALYATAWYRRVQAEHLLAAIKKLRVGVTTEAEYEQAIRPFVADAEQVREGDAIATAQPVAGAYAITSEPLWVYRTSAHMPEAIVSTLSNWAVLEWTMFTVDPTFNDGRLTSLQIGEMQGNGRPFAGFVRIHAGVVQRLWPSEPDSFPGYTAHPMGGNGRVIYTHVDMDDRATPDEQRRALDFKFSCFTALKRCSDGRQLLDPIMTDPLP